MPNHRHHAAPGRRGQSGLTAVLAMSMAAGLLAVPAGAGELSSARAPSGGSASVRTTDRVAALPRIDGLRPEVPRGRSGHPQLFDDARPAGLSLAAPGELAVAEGGGAGAQSPPALAGAPSTKTASPAPGPASDLAWSLECDGDASTAKPYCQEPTGYYWVHGDIRHQRRAWVVEPGDTPHPQAPQYEYADDDQYVGIVPAREVLVRVADGCGLHADTYTDADGHYSVAFPSWCGEKDATVTLYSLSAPGAGQQVALGVHTGNPTPTELSDMVDDPGLYTVVAGEVGTFNPEADAKCPSAQFCIGGKQLDRDFSSYEEGRLFQEGSFARKGEVARALTILETTMMALDYYRQLVDPARLPQINLVLTDESLEGSDNTAFYRSDQSHLIYTPPWLEWSEFAVVHETGHYFDGGILVKGGLSNYGRWGEPMANLRAGMILGSSYRMPSNNGWAEDMDVQGNWDAKLGQVQVPDLPESTQSGGPGQGWVWRILWDLHDGTGAEPADFGYGHFDQWDGGGGSSDPLDHLINGVVLQYLPQRDGTVHPDYVDRGQPGPDLVDMLDGLACLYGMSHLDLATMLHEVMGYDYDFAHCSEVDDLSP